MNRHWGVLKGQVCAICQDCSARASLLLLALCCSLCSASSVAELETHLASRAGTWGLWSWGSAARRRNLWAAVTMHAVTEVLLMAGERPDARHVTGV